MTVEMHRTVSHSEIQVWNSDYINGIGREEIDENKIVVQCKELDSGDFVVEIVDREPMIEKSKYQDIQDKCFELIDKSASWECRFVVVSVIAVLLLVWGIVT